MLIKMSLFDHLARLVDFVGINLLCLLPLPNCLINVSPPTFSATLLKLFLSLTISAVSGVAHSIKSAPTHFAGETTYTSKNGIAVLSKAQASEPNSLPSCQPIPLKYGITICSEATIL